MQSMISCISVTSLEKNPEIRKLVSNCRKESLLKFYFFREIIHRKRLENSPEYKKVVSFHINTVSVN